MTQTRQRDDESPQPVARSRTAVLAERIPIRRIILVTLSILIAAGVLVGSYKTLTLTEGRISAAGWRDFLVFGVALGSIYALIALGYTLVYGILLMINFAHGDVMMFGAYAGFFVLAGLDAIGFTKQNQFAALVIIFAAGMLVSMITGLMLERIAYRPLRAAPRLVPLITAIGASVFLQEAARLVFGAPVR